MNETTAPQTDRTPWKTLERYAGTRVSGLQNRYRDGVPAAKATLAQLRRCDPATSEGVLEAWESVFSGAPQELIGHGDSPTRAENALAAALHLYAVHQQSKQDPMHVAGTGLGAAIRRLANPGEPDSRERPTMRRYHALSTATEPAEILHHLRGLIRQLRDAGIPLDYATLASDIYFLGSPATRTQVRLTWARDLMRKPKTENDDPEPSAAA
ncbi:type I-E CRISPR-associated protein Cse2/CasB [Leucobacter sp. wl10]|uniref:type I-E CRISPR-associated protein Cse2/CasB n=1 Tax=Leucobacter sp. wl10 TaxID=2304677 RepID=UPI000E5B59E6|nr:type I-E CRISPR-associated protein Cse2/CasB [Leucobacter sp. wl10]RGE19820.1 type I-E CRISPR-associated protein Cse2/CasB [Leucobacter sp. wl10]